MNSQFPKNAAPAMPRRPWLTRATFIAFLAGGAVAAGVTAFASGTDMARWHHGMMMGGAHSDAEASAHIDHVLKHLYVEIDATDAQKAQIEPLAKQALNDLLPLRSQLQAAHRQAIDGLTQATVDRAALENARQAHLRLVDQGSLRLTQLIGDVGEVLTPAQRSALAAHLQRMHGMPSP
jgi:Spy/CpxP family protein refolding chaperone